MAPEIGTMVIPPGGVVQSDRNHSLTNYCDDLTIIGDTVFILDRDRLSQFYVYRITRG